VCFCIFSLVCVRWRVYTAALDSDTLEPLSGHHATLNNYLSFGCDAKVCHQFHAFRESAPTLFSSRFTNKLFYTAGGTVAFFEEHVSLESVVRLSVDGRGVKLPADVCMLYVLCFVSLQLTNWQMAL
jgi:hypothetical protein